jgi:putative phage-type endonuclease
MNEQVQETPQQRSALRLVSTKGMSREDWLAVRKQGLGASEAAAAVGLNPYQSPLELWMIKTGRDQHLPQPDPDDDTKPIYWGNVLEPIVAECYARRTGNKVRRVNAVLQHPDPDKHWMLANLDYSVVASPDVQVLECKTAGRNGAKLWDDGVPDYVECQVQHQLAVTGKAAADVCVLICGQELRVHRIKRNEEVIAQLIQLERHFWRYVETDTPPPTDGSDSADRSLRGLYPTDSGETIDFQDDEPLCDAFSRLLDVRAELDRLRGHESRLKQQIQNGMGEASRAVFPNGEVRWQRSRDRQTLDVDRLASERPELVAQYPLTKPGSRRFIVRS